MERRHEIFHFTKLGGNMEESLSNEAIFSHHVYQDIGQIGQHYYPVYTFIQKLI